MFRKLTVVLLLLTGAAFAQTDRGTIRGIVTDSGGAVVPNAAVEVTNVLSGVIAQANTNGSGVYNIPALLAGQYKLTVDAPGFRSFVQPDLEVNLGNVSNLDVKLSVGAANEVVTVSSSVPILKTEQSDTSTEVDTIAYNQLPVNATGGRNASSFRNLVPGVNGASVNGGPQYAAEVQVDGASIVSGELFGDSRNLKFPPDAVQQLSFTTSAYSAEYGQTGDGVERYEIKSGTNEYHGSMYEYLKNTIFDAAGYFNKVTPIDHQHEYGFSVGGPVSIPGVYNGKNRSFFFVNGDWFRTKSAGSTSAGVSLPTDAMLRGDFSALLSSGITIYDPATTSAVGNTYTRQPFPNNIIPASRFSPIGAKILSYYRSGLLPGTTINQNLFQNNATIPQTASTSHVNTVVVKGDQLIGVRHHISVTLQHSTNPFINASLYADPVNNQIPNGRLYELARAAYDLTVSPTMLNQLRFSYNRQTQSQVSTDFGKGYVSNLGLGGGFSTAPDFFPTINAGAYGTNGTTTQPLANTHGVNIPISNTYILSDAFSWSLGRHSLKFGIEARDYRHSVSRNSPASLSFSRNETASPAALATTGNEIASALLGQVDSSTIPNYAGVAPTYFWKTVDAYAQDDWKATSRLTLNLGLRYSLMTPMAERKNEYSVFDQTAINPATGLPGAYVYAGVNGQGNRLTYAKDDLNYFAPRFGFAYKVHEGTVIGGGFGVSYFPNGAYGTGNNTFLVDGFTTTSSIASPNTGISPAFQLDQGFPTASLQTPSRDYTYGINGGFNYWPSTANSASYIRSYNLSLQQAFGKDWVTTVSYVGTQGRRLGVRGNINQVPSQYAALGNVLLGKLITDPAVAAAGFKTPYLNFVSQLGSRATLAQALRPFPAYQGGGPLSSDMRGVSEYDALQVKVDKRFTGGLYLLAAFTWSKSLTNANATFNTGETAVIDEYDLTKDWTNADLDLPIRQTVAATYDLPFGQGKHFLGGAGRLTQSLLGGWTLNAILTYQSGNLIAVGASDNLGIFAGPQYAYLNGTTPIRLPFDGHAGATGSKYLNQAAFTQLPSTTTSFSPGKHYVPGVRSQIYSNEDLSVIKQVPITERYKGELRFEAFGALNRTIFNAPNTTLTSPAFGTITSQRSTPRNAQVVFKLTF